MAEAISTLELHELSLLFPRMSDAEFAGLRADIKANGQRSPIVLYQGKVLEGGHRYRACLAEGKTPKFTEYAGEDPVAFVLSMNLHRRHLSAGQQAAIVAAMQDWGRAQSVGNPRFTRSTPLQAGRAQSGNAATLERSGAQSGNPAALHTVADRAALSGASERTQRMADKVARQDPELIKRVAHGEVPLAKAVAEVDGRRKHVEPPMAELPKRQAVTPPPAVEPEEDEADAAAAEEARAGAGQQATPTLSELLEEAQADCERLTAELRAATANDLAAEAVKWHRAYDNAQRQQSEAMDRAHKSVEREAWTMRQLRRCGKAVGQDDPSRIAATVEAFVRDNKKVAA